MMNDILAEVQAERANSPEAQLRNAAMSLFQDTDPLRRLLIRRSRRFLSNGVMDSPEFMALKEMAGRQADMAKDNILETMPNGGVLLDKLADVDIDKARTLTQGAGALYGDNMNRAFSLATGTPLTASMGGLGALTQLESAREQAEADRDAAAKGGIGSAVGGILGGK